MIGSKPDGREIEAPGRKFRWIQRGVLGAVCALVIGIYAHTAHSGSLESLNLNAADTYYNLLVQGFRARQLSLKKDVPSGLAQLADPYDSTANALYRSAPYGMDDLSYYKGRLYLYFGVTPALILFWPFVALTGHYLLSKQAAAIFCAIGFLASAGLLGGIWRRYFAKVSVGVVAACALALGLATGVPVLLPRSEVYEVAISCGYMLMMLALGAIWCALHERERRCWWLAAASVAYGLAVGARPSLLLSAVVLLVPVAQAWRERRPLWALLMAATGPIVLIGFGLMLYNVLRFDSPFEFGQRYQLGGVRQDTVQHFSSGYLWFNLRVYFLEPVRWSHHFPFVEDMAVPPLPPGHGKVEKPFGILTNVSLVWLTLAVPLVWRRRSTEESSNLRWFMTAVGLLFGISTLTLGLYYFTASRYEVEFLSALVLLAVVGILGLERAMAIDQPVWRRAARSLWVLLLGFSVVFNLLASVEHYAAADNDLGAVLMEIDRIEDAIGHYEQALRIKPHYADAHYNLGGALAQAGRMPEAIRHWEQALRIKPDFAEAHNDLGTALMQVGKLEDAVGHYEQALRIKPDFAEAHNNFGAVLVRLGRTQEAIGHFEQALRIRQDYIDALYNLAVVLEKAGRIPEAIGQCEHLLRIQPGAVEVQNRLARLRAVR